MLQERRHSVALIGAILVLLSVWPGWTALGMSPVRSVAAVAALPDNVTAEVVLDLGPGPVKVQRVSTSSWERDLYPGESGVQAVQVRNVTDGYGEASYTVDAVVSPLAPLVVSVPAGPVSVAPGGVDTLTWTLAVPAEAAVGPYEEVIELKAEGVVFARWQVRAGAGEPLVFRGFSYLNPSGNDVSAYVLWPKGTARFRVNAENQGDAALNVVVDLTAEAGLTCAADPANATLAAGKSLEVVITCEGTPFLDSSNDRVTVRLRRIG